MKKQLAQPLASIKIKFAATMPIPGSRERSVLRKIYDVELTRVLVTWQEILPSVKEFALDKAVFFFPGWPLKADSKSLQVLSEEIANHSGARTYVIHTRSEQIIPNPVYQEAQAICKFLVEQEIKHVILVGYSQGGIKAIDTIVLLQEMNPHIQIESLILIVPVGLNEIDAGELARRYIVDFLITSSLAILREIARNPSLREKFNSFIENATLSFNGCLAFFQSILEEVRVYHLRYRSKFKNELKEMSNRSPYLSEIKVPIVLIQGAQDRVSDRLRMLTQARAQLDNTQFQDARAKDLFVLYKDNTEQLLLENLFPHSPYVRMVQAEKFGTHVLPLFRPKSVARASFYLLNKYIEE